MSSVARIYAKGPSTLVSIDLLVMLNVSHVADFVSSDYQSFQS
jgi:hypothetical protein